MRRYKKRSGRKRNQRDEQSKGPVTGRSINPTTSGPLPVASLGWSYLQRLGNRATERAFQHSQVSGSFPVRQIPPDQLRQMVLQQAVLQANKAPAALQRQEDGADITDAADVIALDVPAGVQTGKVTIEDPKVVEYEVTGKSLSDVYSQLDPDEWGRCKWTVDYDYDTANGKATKVNITLHLTIRMPKWTTGADGASPAARAEWQRMLRALRGHEDGHADIARKWAPVFKERMLKQPEGLLGQKYQKTFADMEAEESKFDDDTQHGQTQGVSLDTTIQ